MWSLLMYLLSYLWPWALLLYVFFDFHYYLRVILVVLVSKIFFKVQNPLEEITYYGICLTTDMDFQWHMNNARYLRDCDFARYEFWIVSGVQKSVKKLKGYMTVGASTIRYRRSIQLFDTYQIKTRIVCWDEKAFYLEQRFVRNKDKFVNAVVIIKQTTIGVKPDEVMANILGTTVQSPEMPEEIKKWVEYNSLSSERLLKQS